MIEDRGEAYYIVDSIEVSIVGSIVVMIVVIVWEVVPRA